MTPTISRRRKNVWRYGEDGKGHVMARRGPNGDLRAFVQKLAEMNSAPPWRQVLMRYKVGALSSFLKRSRNREQFLESYNSLYASVKEKRQRQALVALIDGLAHCSNELATPLRALAHKQATLKAQGQRIPGTGRYSATADIDVRRKKSYTGARSKH